MMISAADCGDGFSFQRQKVGLHFIWSHRHSFLIVTWKVGETLAYSYAPDYLDEASECGDEVMTSEEYQDQVRFLNVGATYKYSISAVAKEYMVDPDGSMLRKSEPLLLEHTVAWVSLSFSRFSESSADFPCCRSRLQG